MTGRSVRMQVCVSRANVSDRDGPALVTVIVLMCATVLTGVVVDAAESVRRLSSNRIVASA
jgi:chemotaxis signal transduction protein